MPLSPTERSIRAREARTRARARSKELTSRPESKAKAAADKKAADKK